MNSNNTDCKDNISHFDILCATLKTDEGKEKIKQNFDEILKKCKMSDFFRFIKLLDGIPGFEKEYEDYSFWGELYEQIQINIPKIELGDIFKMPQRELQRINMLRDATVTKDIFFRKFISSPSKEEKQIILQEISQGKPYEFRGAGSSSFNIQTGNKVVKLGLNRRKFKIPYHPRIMMPYFRKQYEDETVLEVFNFGNVESSKITDEELLKIYQELEAAGIMWGDARKDNLLVLLEDNELPEFIASEEFNVFGFLEDERFPTNNHKVLKKGDIVVCDLDFLYAKGDPEYKEGLPDDIIIDYLMFKNGNSPFTSWEDNDGR